tara:strand:+ start:1586 stop:2353 length:768 start_codon:yes stop_codon:yes gene_type:complete
MRIKLFTILLILLFILLSCSSNNEISDETLKPEPDTSNNEISDETLKPEPDTSNIDTDENKIDSNRFLKDDSEQEPFLIINFLQESTARYLITEQLANLDFPIDAIGETNQINGSIIFTKNGNIIEDESKITVNVNSLKSDSSRRDRYISRRSLESEKYPEATIFIKEIKNLPWPLPEIGSAEINIIGDMNVHGVTNKIIWDTEVNFDKNKLNGIAKTNFKFEKFNMDLPRVAIVLSVENNIRLELDFVAEKLNN